MRNLYLSFSSVMLVGLLVLSVYLLGRAVCLTIEDLLRITDITKNSVFQIAERGLNNLEYL